MSISEQKQIIDLDAGDEAEIRQTAALLYEAFSDRPSGWTDYESAIKEVLKSLQPERISRVAIDDDGDVLGWIGGISHYQGNVWELHPWLLSRNGAAGESAEASSMTWCVW